MNAADILVLLVSASQHVANLASVYGTMRAEGRDEPTAEETARIRAGTLASEDRLEAAIGAQNAAG